VIWFPDYLLVDRKISRIKSSALCAGGSWRLAGGYQIKYEMSAACQIILDALQSHNDITGLQQMVQRIKISGDQIDLTSQMQTANILVKENNV
jgi:hypothetical protein